MTIENRDTDSIAEPRRRLNEAFLRSDVATVLSYYGDNAVLMAPNVPARLPLMVGLSGSPLSNVPVPPIWKP